jgi:hypothetical protein
LVMKIRMTYNQRYVQWLDTGVMLTAKLLINLRVIKRINIINPYL